MRRPKSWSDSYRFAAIFWLFEKAVIFARPILADKHKGGQEDRLDELCRRENDERRVPWPHARKETDIDGYPQPEPNQVN